MDSTSTPVSTPTPVSTFEFFVVPKKNTYELEYRIKQAENADTKKVVKVITYPMYQSLDDININDTEVDVFAIGNAQDFSNVREFLLKCEIFGKSAIITVDDQAENFKEIINAIPLADSFVKENGKFLKKNLPKIALFMGPMRAGKSYEIIRLIDQCKILKLNITKIIPSNDTRSDGEIKSRSGASSKALKIKDLSNVSAEIFNLTDVFVLDEAQFFDGLYEFVKKCKENNKTVLISGLDGCSNRKKFGEVLDCIPYCDEVVKLTALCMDELDGTRAIFSYLIKENPEEVNGQVLIGDLQFLSLSRKAFLEMEN